MRHHLDDIHADEEENEINLTPMLDVVFIMLIFFIVTATFIKAPGEEVERPDTTTADKQEDAAILVAITAADEIWIDRKKRDPKTVRTVLEALKAGRHYSSTGPEIRDIAIEGKEIHVECSAAAAMIVSGKGAASKAVHGESMTRASMKLARFGECPWIRVTVVDAAGRRAWSNPIWRE